MADNRMYLRCKGCGAELMLGKRLIDDGWYFSLSNEDKGRQLQAFLQQHSDCCFSLEHDTLGGMSPCDPDFEPFELVYENREDWGHMQTLQQKDRELHPDLYNQ